MGGARERIIRPGGFAETPRGLRLRQDRIVSVRGPRTTRVVGWLAALAAIAVFCSLGRWQLARMHEKQAMLEASRLVLAQRHALPLQAALDPSRARVYDWASGPGRFADGPAVLLDNQMHDGRPGVRAYRLFLPGTGPGAGPVLVELGWLPVGGDRVLPQVAPLPGTRSVQGLLLPPPSSGLAAPVAQAQADGTILSTALDAPGLPGLLGVQRLPPRVLRLDPALPPAYQRDLDILPNTLPPERHLGYAVQWFALAAAVLVTALVLTFRRRRTPARSR